MDSHAKKKMKYYLYSECEMVRLDCICVFFFNCCIKYTKVTVATSQTHYILSGKSEKKILSDLIWSFNELNFGIGPLIFHCVYEYAMMDNL